MVKENKKTILIVEDEPSTMKALVERFTQEGLETIEAKNGEEGLELALKNHPALILLDIIMPRMDGMTMLKKLRDDEWGKNAEVVILTNLTDPRKISEALEEKVYDFWIKADWKLDDLIKSIKKKIK